MPTATRELSKIEQTKLLEDYWAHDNDFNFIFLLTDLSIRYKIPPWDIEIFASQQPAKLYCDSKTCDNKFVAKSRQEFTDQHLIEENGSKLCVCSNCYQMKGGSSKKTLIQPFIQQRNLELFTILRKIYPNTFPKIVLSRLVDNVQIENLFKKYNKYSNTNYNLWASEYILKASLDLLICDTYTTPLFAIDFRNKGYTDRERIKYEILNQYGIQYFLLPNDKNHFLNFLNLGEYEKDISILIDEQFNHTPEKKEYFSDRELTQRLEHNGLIGNVCCSYSKDLMYGHILNVDALICYVGSSFKELNENFIFSADMVQNAFYDINKTIEINSASESITNSPLNLYRTHHNAGLLFHRGIFGSIKYYKEKELWHGESQNINTNIKYAGKTFNELMSQFQQLSETYLNNNELIYY